VLDEELVEEWMDVAHGAYDHFVDSARRHLIYCDYHIPHEGDPSLHRSIDVYDDVLLAIPGYSYRFTIIISPYKISHTCS
jgi:hypothetical protein